MDLKKPRGMEDWAYETAQKLMTLETILRNIVYSYNFSEIRTPILEHKDLFVRSVGDSTDIVTKEMFEVIDKKDRIMVMRPEATAPTIRSIIENKYYASRELPLKYFYIGPMFRYERPQSGRLRQFHQFGIEVVGVKSTLLDFEIIMLGYTILKSLNLNNFNLELNSIGGTQTRLNYSKELNKYVKGLTLCDDCKTRINKNLLRILDCKIDQEKFNHAPKIYNFLSENEKNNFENLQNLLTNAGVNYSINHKLVRGLDYYNDVVFEFTYPINNTILTVLGGGRYDTLINQLNSQLNYPAIGFALGLERLLNILDNEKFDFGIKNNLLTYLICLNEKAQLFGANLLYALRNAGITCDMDYLNRSFKSQFKSSTRLGSKYVIIIGDDEIKSKKLKIKHQITGKEKVVPLNKIINFLLKEGGDK